MNNITIDQFDFLYLHKCLDIQENLDFGRSFKPSRFRMILKKIIQFFHLFKPKEVIIDEGLEALTFGAIIKLTEAYKPSEVVDIVLKDLGYQPDIFSDEDKISIFLRINSVVDNIKELFLQLQEGIKSDPIISNVSKSVPMSPTMSIVVCLCNKWSCKPSEVYKETWSDVYWTLQSNKQETLINQKMYEQNSRKN